MVSGNMSCLTLEGIPELPWKRLLKSTIVNAGNGREVANNDKEKVSQNFKLLSILELGRIWE